MSGRSGVALSWSLLAALALALGLVAVGAWLAPQGDGARGAAALLDASLPVGVEGATFGFTLDAPGWVEVQVEAPAGWHGTLARLLPAVDRRVTYVPEGALPLRDEGSTAWRGLSLTKAGAYVLRIEPIPTAMGESPPRARVRLRRMPEAD